MNKVIYLCFFAAVFVSCTEKQPKPVNTVELPFEEVLEEPKSVAMYVNSKEGLRVRDMPDRSGKILETLEHKSLVSVIGQSDGETVIDGITDYWYSVKINEINGWVFGGYLKETLEEIVAEEIVGVYIADDITILSENGFTHRSYFTILNNGLIDKSDVSFEITHIKGDEFLLKYNLPFFGQGNNSEYDKKNFNFKNEMYNSFFHNEMDKSFFHLVGESSGGIYINFYHNVESINVNLYEVRGSWDGSDTRSFRCLIVFKKISSEQEKGQ